MNRPVRSRSRTDMPDLAPDVPSTPGTDVARVRRLLRHQLHALWDHPEAPHAVPPMMLWGPPGVGKSTVIRELCEEEGIDFIDIRLAQRDPVDIRGLPVPKDEAVDWLLSSDWPRDRDSRGIILFDELTAADRSLQVAVYEIILDRRLGSLYELPPGWMVCAAGNRSEDRAVATTFSSALANRLCHLEITPDLESWLPWARSRGIHPDVIGFLRFQPHAFFSMDGNLERGWPSPRTWERVSDTLHRAERTGLPQEDVSLLVQGLVGPGAGVELMAFRAWHRTLPDVPAMLRGEAEITIPERADHRYALCAAAVYYLWQGPQGGSDALVEGFFRLTLALPSDFATLALVDALNAPDEAETERRSERLLMHPAFNAWSERHGQAFAQRWDGVSA
ncbi:ATP-binding protein [Alkalilimnicola ehrlichii MLHE-1]|nr:AAA family ATPase [Alkalilimnicola ehrlichii]